MQRVTRPNNQQFSLSVTDNHMLLREMCPQFFSCFVYENRPNHKFTLFCRLNLLQMYFLYEYIFSELLLLENRLFLDPPLLLSQVGKTSTHYSVAGWL